MHVEQDLVGWPREADMPPSQLQCHCWVGRLFGYILLPAPFLVYKLCSLYNKWICSIRPFPVVLVEEEHCCPNPSVDLGVCWLENPQEIPMFVFHRNNETVIYGKTNPWKPHEPKNMQKYNSPGLALQYSL